MTEPGRVFDLAEDQEAALSEAARAVAAGECIVLPTDTVYGIGANAFDVGAVQRLLDAKRRGRDMPPPVLIAEPSMLRAIVDEVPAGAAALAKEFWPGALTLILQAQSKSGMELGDTFGTVAVRVPDNEDARSLLRRTGPLAVSSANVSGEMAATDCQSAVDQLGETVAVYLDGGPSQGGEASTIVDFTADREGRVLRAGAISLSELQRVAAGVKDRSDAAGPAAPTDVESVTESEESSSEEQTSIEQPVPVPDFVPVPPPLRPEGS